MKIHLTLDGRVIPATLADNGAAHAFAAMLPLAITLHGLFGREKFGPLPGAMPAAELRTRPYEVGDIVCWSAGPDLAILHAQDGQAISGGFHVLGRIDSGAESFGAPGPLDVRIELAPGDEMALPGVAALLRTPASPCRPSL
ncbi:cyclophilin-like fold protein [Variovorax sp. LT2P21]|uniref:cyclophilin-like fold protein n=1 Tax=Variovorax sp. LT2P21 TaxID=3443731 RepID=UPI003F48B30E